MTGPLVWLDVGIMEKRFAPLDANKGVTDIRFARANRLNLAALQLDAGLVAFKNVKIAERFAIEDRLGRHDRASARDTRLLSTVGGRLLRRQLPSELASNDLSKSDVAERSTRSGFDERPMAQPQLADAAGDDVDQQLLIRDHLSCFLQELSGHISQ